MVEVEQVAHITVDALRTMLAGEGVSIGVDAKLSVTRSKESGERLRIVWTQDAKAGKGGGK